MTYVSSWNTTNYSQNYFEVTSGLGDTFIQFTGIPQTASSMWISIARLRTLGVTINTDLMLRFNLDSTASYIYDNNYRTYIYAGTAAGTQNARSDGSQSFSLIHMQGLSDAEYKTVTVYAAYNNQGTGLTPTVNTLQKRGIYKTSAVITNISFALVGGAAIGSSSRFELWVAQ